MNIDVITINSSISFAGHHFVEAESAQAYVDSIQEPAKSLFDIQIPFPDRVILRNKHTVGR
jgi:hypothetical protein